MPPLYIIHFTINQNLLALMSSPYQVLPNSWYIQYTHRALEQISYYIEPCRINITLRRINIIVFKAVENCTVGVFTMASMDFHHIYGQNQSLLMDHKHSKFILCYYQMYGDEIPMPSGEPNLESLTMAFFVLCDYTNICPPSPPSSLLMFYSWDRRAH